MCIQQPQDSSQRSAVIAHYNQSSQAHLSSPFGIKNGEKHKTKPQSSRTHLPSCPSYTNLCQGSKMKGQGFATGALHRGSQSTRTGYGDRWRDPHEAGMRASTQPAPAGTAAALHKTLPKSQPKCLNTGSFSPHTGAGVSCRARAFPITVGSQHPAVAALPAPRFTSPSPEARAEPEQGEAMTKVGDRSTEVEVRSWGG